MDKLMCSILFAITLGFIPTVSFAGSPDGGAVAEGPDVQLVAAVNVPIPGGDISGGTVEGPDVEVVAVVNTEPILGRDIRLACDAHGSPGLNVLETLIDRRLSVQKLRRDGVTGHDLGLLADEELLELIRPTPRVSETQAYAHYRGHLPVFEASSSRLFREVEQAPKERTPQEQLTYIGLGSKSAWRTEWKNIEVGHSSPRYFRDGRWWIAKCEWAEDLPARTFDEVRPEIQRLLQLAMTLAHHARIRAELRANAAVEVRSSAPCPLKARD